MAGPQLQAYPPSPPLSLLSHFCPKFQCQSALTLIHKAFLYICTARVPNLRSTFCLSQRAGRQAPGSTAPKSGMRHAAPGLGVGEAAGRGPGSHLPGVSASVTPTPGHFLDPRPHVFFHWLCRPRGNALKPPSVAGASRKEEASTARLDPGPRVSSPS